MKKIALIVDVKGWAFDFTALLIQKSLTNYFKIDIFYATDDFNKDLFMILEAVKDYDIIHFFWRKILLDFEKNEFKNKVIKKYKDYNEYEKNIVKKISTAVCDHLYEDDITFNKIFTKHCNKYTVTSQILMDIYSNQNYYKKPACIMPDSFDKSNFAPINIDRFKNIQSELIIGWVGNSTWASNLKDMDGNTIDFKGFHTILMPVIKELLNEGYKIKLECADKNIKKIPNNEMSNYYSKIHIYVCVSYNEGTPRPLIEAMGCGVPVITTDVGIAKQALGKKQQNFILDKRIIGKNDFQIRQKLKDKIILLYNNRDILIDLSKENIENSKKYEIENVKNIYLSYFSSF